MTAEFFINVIGTDGFKAQFSGLPKDVAMEVVSSLVNFQLREHCQERFGSFGHDAAHSDHTPGLPAPEALRDDDDATHMESELIDAGFSQLKTNVQELLVSLASIGIPQSISELQNRIGYGNEIYPRLSQLEQKGFVKKSIAPNTRHSKIVEVTPKGQMVVEAHMQADDSPTGATTPR